MTAFPTLKNNYYIRRLAPFLIVYLVYELIEVAILAFLQQTGTDWNSLTLLRLLGNLLVETCSSFLYLIIPYLLSFNFTFFFPFHDSFFHPLFIAVFQAIAVTCLSHLNRHCG